jgi:hypothetical protein
MVHGGNLLRSDNCGFATYECRTVYDTELADNQWKRAEQSVSCHIRENQLLTKQRDEARERIKRLEEAGDKMANSMSNCTDIREYIGAIHNWNKSKEAKL